MADTYIEKLSEMLKRKMRSDNTIKAYETDARQYLDFCEQNGKDIASGVYDFKRALAKKKLAAATINRKLLAVDKLLMANGIEQVRAGQVKIQVSLNLDNVLSLNDLGRLIRWADKMGDDLGRAIIIALAGTGLRVSELQYITVEALKAGRAEVNNKGTLRDVPLTGVKAPLLDYAHKVGITGGMLFATASGRPLDNPAISRRLKKIAGRARVKLSKVHPHAFRHLFALVFAQKSGNDIATLADILGHKSINTTRIYTRATSKEKAARVKTFNPLAGLKL